MDGGTLLLSFPLLPKRSGATKFCNCKNSAIPFPPPSSHQANPFCEIPPSSSHSYFFRGIPPSPFFPFAPKRPKGCHWRLFFYWQNAFKEGKKTPNGNPASLEPPLFFFFSRLLLSFFLCLLLLPPLSAPPSKCTGEKERRKVSRGGSRRNCSWGGGRRGFGHCHT